MFIEDGDSVKSDELYAYVSSQLTRNWKVFVGNRYDLDQHRSIKFLSGLEYENDCFKFNINLVNDYTRDKDYVGDKSIYFTLAFKTLGSISSSFGVSSDSN
jgi:LPS-assembly protein